MKVLIVDDKYENLYLLRVLLSGQNYDVIEASNGKEALDLARQTPPDLIISDILMPVMDGFALCREWKIDSQLHSIPFIFYTATYTEAKDKEFSLSLGADLFLVKPLEPQVFLSEINHVLEQKRANDGPVENKADMNDDNFYRQYNVRLVHKLEDKLTEIEQKNNQLTSKEQALRVANIQLEQQNDMLMEEIKLNKKINDELIESKKIIQKNEHELNSIINNLIEGVFLVDDKFTIINNNQAAAAIFGYEKEKLCGLDLKRLIPDIKSLQDTINEKENDDKWHFSNEKYQGQHKNKTPIPLRLSLIKLPEPDNKKFVCSCLDITHQEQQEEQLRRSQKMQALGKLTGGIAHDYNNMLGVITGYAELLEQALNKQPKLAHYAHEIRYAGERGSKLTNKLLAFSRQKVPMANGLNLNDLLQNQQHMLEKSLTVRVKLVFDLADDLWHVCLDSSDLEDAVLNISINALHAMKTGGQLTIQTSNVQLDELSAGILQVDMGDYVLLSISDTGTGMDKNTKDKIFEPFFSTKGDMGTGLGLSQVYGFVERSGGAIQVYSELGRGTRMALYFPRYHKNASEDKPKKDNNAVNFKGNETILVVDDELALLELCCEILEQQGFNVISADSAKKALDILEHKSVDLLITDVIMPNMDGYQLASIVQEKYPAIKIQIASGYSDNHNVDSSNESLHQNLLYKPFKPQVLLQRVRELLDE